MKKMNRFGKLLSRLFMAAAVFTSCQDDDIAGSAVGTPLQVSVTANSPLVSRTIVTDDYLPDKSSIGLSLFTPQGESYDGQNYNNIKFTAAGTGASQTWAGASEVSLSGNEAYLLAYWPYDGELESPMTLPVETATQTDYMYSGLVTGISNVKPDVDITMNHALTAVRVRLVLGDYTGNVAVSNVSVASPALGTAAECTVFDGALSDIEGQGDAVALDVDFDMTAEGTNTDVMLVPDASVESGITEVMVTIGGNEYIANISFDEAYKQGYIYTYTLTLNNKGFEVTKVAVTPWGEGTNDTGSFEPDKFADALVATFVVDDVSQPVYLVSPEFVVVNEEVGDEFNQILAMSVDGVDVEPTYTWMFTTPGKHVVKYILSDMTVLPDMFKGQFAQYIYSGAADEYIEFVQSRDGGYFECYDFPYLTEVYMPDSFVEIKQRAFQGCQDLKKIRLSRNLTVLGDAAFYMCSSLEELVFPKNLVVYSNGISFDFLLSLKKLVIPGIIFDSDEVSSNYFTLNDCPELVFVEMPDIKNLRFNIGNGCNKLEFLVLQEGLEWIQLGYVFYGDEHKSLKYIVSKATQAPEVGYNSLWNVAETGTIYVPTGATGYEAWLSDFVGWTIQYVDDIDAKTEEIMQQIEEYAAEQEELKKQYAVDYANGLKVLVEESGTHQILSDDFNLDLVKTMFVTESGTKTKTVIDVSKTVTLDRTEFLTVTLKDATNIPDGMFKNVTPFFSLLIPESCKSFGDEVFSGSNMLGLGFIADTPPSVTESSLEGLKEDGGPILYPTNEKNDYTVWQEFLAKFPTIWQEISGPEDMSEFKLFFEY